MQRLLSTTLLALAAFGFVAAGTGAKAQTRGWRWPGNCKILTVQVVDQTLVISGERLTRRRSTPEVTLGGGNPLTLVGTPSRTEIVVDLTPILTDLTAPKDFLLEIARFRGDNSCPSPLLTIAPPPEKKIVFVTSASYDGALTRDALGPDGPDSTDCGTGLAGADCICGRFAESAGLPGTYKAWLADRDSSPDTRFNKSSASYVLPDGKTVVAKSYADLTDQSIEHAIDQTETGEQLASASDVWTNTDPTGKLMPYLSLPSDCGQWSSIGIEVYGGRGSSAATDKTWTELPQPGLCGEEYARLYCFQQ